MSRRARCGRSSAAIYKQAIAGAASVTRDHDFASRPVVGMQEIVVIGAAVVQIVSFRSCGGLTHLALIA